MTQDQELIPVVRPHDDWLEIPYEIRDQHIYIPGGTRRGKSSQLLHLIMQDVNNGCGVGVLDPKGDLIKAVCDQLPEEREEDIIYLDLKTPVPIDFMSYTDPAEINPLISDLVFIVTKGDANLPAAEPLLRRTFRTLLHVPGTSFLDAYRFFTDMERCDYIKNELIKHNFDLWKSWQRMPDEKESRPIRTRMEGFYLDPSMKIVFGEPNPALNFNRIMDERKILLVNLAPITADNQLYGALIVSKFQQAALRRSDTRPSERIPFFLYVDEFEFFQTDSFPIIFSLAGGLGLRLTIGNQYIDQLTSAVRTAVFGNAGTYIIFELGPDDLARFKNLIRPYDASLLTRPFMKPHQACFIIGSELPVWKHTPPPPDLDEDHAERVLERIRQKTLAKYGVGVASGSTIRTIPTPPSNPMPVTHTEGHGDSAIPSKSEEPKAAGIPNVPYHGREKKNPRPPR